VADRPLRPATDHRLGGPLPHQQANRTRAHPKPHQALATPKGPHHPVLAAVSRGCPRAWGRFPRVTHPSATRPGAEAPNPVRLACVRRAASVRSEPGSNSQFHAPAASVPKARAPKTRAGLPATRHRKTIADGHPRRRSKVNAWPPDLKGRVPDAQTATPKAAACASLPAHFTTLSNTTDATPDALGNPTTGCLPANRVNSGHVVERFGCRRSQRDVGRQAPHIKAYFASALPASMARGGGREASRIAGRECVRWGSRGDGSRGQSCARLLARRQAAAGPRLVSRAKAAL
jgi:hypothetical protein